MNADPVLRRSSSDISFQDLHSEGVAAPRNPYPNYAAKRSYPQELPLKQFRRKQNYKDRNAEEPGKTKQVRKELINTDVENISDTGSFWRSEVENVELDIERSDTETRESTKDRNISSPPELRRLRRRFKPFRYREHNLYSKSKNNGDNTNFTDSSHEEITVGDAVPIVFSTNDEVANYWDTIVEDFIVDDHSIEIPLEERPEFENPLLKDVKLPLTRDELEEVLNIQKISTEKQIEKYNKLSVPLNDDIIFASEEIKDSQNISHIEFILDEDEETISIDKFFDEPTSQTKPRDGAQLLQNFNKWRKQPTVFSKLLLNNSLELITDKNVSVIHHPLRPIQKPSIISSDFKVQTPKTGPRTASDNWQPTTKFPVQKSKKNLPQVGSSEFTEYKEIPMRYRKRIRPLKNINKLRNNSEEITTNRPILISKERSQTKSKGGRESTTIVRVKPQLFASTDLTLERPSYIPLTYPQPSITKHFRRPQRVRSPGAKKIRKKQTQTRVLPYLSHFPELIKFLANNRYRSSSSKPVPIPSFAEPTSYTRPKSYNMRQNVKKSSPSHNKGNTRKRSPKPLIISGTPPANFGIYNNNKLIPVNIIYPNQQKSISGISYKDNPVNMNSVIYGSYHQNLDYHSVPTERPLHSGYLLQSSVSQGYPENLIHGKHMRSQGSPSTQNYAPLHHGNIANEPMILPLIFPGTTQPVPTSVIPLNSRFVLPPTHNNKIRKIPSPLINYSPARHMLPPSYQGLSNPTSNFKLPARHSLPVRAPNVIQQQYNTGIPVRHSGTSYPPIKIETAPSSFQGANYSPRNNIRFHNHQVGINNVMPHDNRFIRNLQQSNQTPMNSGLLNTVQTNKVIPIFHNGKLYAPPSGNLPIVYPGDSTSVSNGVEPIKIPKLNDAKRTSGSIINMSPPSPLSPPPIVTKSIHMQNMHDELPKHSAESIPTPTKPKLPKTNLQAPSKLSMLPLINLNSPSLRGNVLPRKNRHVKLTDDSTIFDKFNTFLQTSLPTQSQSSQAEDIPNSTTTILKASPVLRLVPERRQPKPIQSTSSVPKIVNKLNSSKYIYESKPKLILSTLEESNGKVIKAQTSIDQGSKKLDQRLSINAQGLNGRRTKSSTSRVDIRTKLKVPKIIVGSPRMSFSQPNHREVTANTRIRFSPRRKTQT